MGWWTNKFEKLAEDEDEDVTNKIKKLYGPLLQIGFVFPYWTQSSVKFTLIIMTLSFCAITSHMTFMGITFLKVTDDFDLFSLIGHYILIAVLCLSNGVLLNAKRSQMAQIHRILARKVAKYSSGDIYLEKRIQELERNKKQELKRFLLLPALVVFITGSCLIVPYVKRLMAEKSRKEAHYTDQGVNMNLPLPSYYPFPTHFGVLHLAALVMQSAAGVVIALHVVSTELLVFRLSQEITFEFKVLQYSIETLVSRAQKLYQQEFPDHDSRELYYNPKLQRCVEACFKECIAHHHDLLKLSAIFDALAKWPGLLVYGIGTVIIGLSLLNILYSIRLGNYENVVLFMLLLFTEVLNMYIISVFGENLTTESDNLRHVLYDIEWVDFDTKNRKLMIIFQIGLKDPVILKAGGAVDISMRSFSMIVNSSTTLFNLMNCKYAQLLNKRRKTKEKSN